ncbi:MAG: hypothetical protein JNM17_23945 [Archangium sp.]|nr:hypothetical protein [Archangium sp.]
MKTLLALVVLSASIALADEPSAPPVMSTEAAEVAQVPTGFLDQALKVNVKNEITEGRSGNRLTHRQVFERMGRTDLIAESLAREQRRTLLAITGGIIAGVAIGAGITVIATGPKLASPECEADVRIYNEICVPRANAHNYTGTAIIVGGVVTGLLLGTIAYWSDPNVLTRDETASLIGTYNSQLAKRLKNSPSGLKLKLMPSIGPDGAALTASLKF